MALVVETGTGNAAAESYASTVDADAYHAARGAAAWAALTPTRKEECLRLAADYMIGAYAGAWQGSRAVATQALDWPRIGVIAFGDVVVRADVVPPAVRDACAALALKASAGPLRADLGRVVKRSKVGPLETEFADYSPQSKRYLSVDRMLAPYLASVNRYAARLERA